MADYKDQIEPKRFLRNGFIAFGGFIGWYFVSLIAGEIISNLLEVDIANQIYQILFLTGFAIAVWFFVIRAKKFKKHIKEISETHPSMSNGMWMIHKIQILFGYLIIIFVLYTIIIEGIEIIEILNS